MNERKKEKRENERKKKGRERKKDRERNEEKNESPSKCQSFFHVSFCLIQKQWPSPVPAGPRGTPQQETQLSSLKKKKIKRGKRHLETLSLESNEENYSVIY